jgi:hypothetical protein
MEEDIFRDKTDERLDLSAPKISDKVLPSGRDVEIKIKPFLSVLHQLCDKRRDPFNLKFGAVHRASLGGDLNFEETSFTADN